MGYSSDLPPFLKKIVVTAAASLLLVTGSSSVFRIRKDTTTGTDRKVIVFETVQNITGANSTGSGSVGNIDIIGNLTMSGAGAFRNLTAANCDVKASGTGQLICGTDAGIGALSSTGGLMIVLDNRYVRKSGGTMTGGLLIKNGNPTATIDTGLLLEVTGSMSGFILHATDSLNSSGTLIIAGATSLRNDLNLGGGNINFTEATTIGDGGDAITIDSNGTLVLNDGTINLSNQTVAITLNSAANALNFDSNTLTIDASANRIGIGTSTPQTALEIIGTGSGRELRAQDRITSSGSLTVQGVSNFIGTASGSKFQQGGIQIMAKRKIPFILTATGSNVTVGQSKIQRIMDFSGSLVGFYMEHGTIGNGAVTYDVNINGITRLSTKLTVDANERCSESIGTLCTDSAATPYVITQPKFAANQLLTIDVDGQAGGTAPIGAYGYIWAVPDPDGYDQ